MIFFLVGPITKILATDPPSASANGTVSGIKLRHKQLNGFHVHGNLIFAAGGVHGS